MMGSSEDVYFSNMGRNKKYNYEHCEWNKYIPEKHIRSRYRMIDISRMGKCEE